MDKNFSPNIFVRAWMLLIANGIIIIPGLLDAIVQRVKEPPYLNAFSISFILQCIALILSIATPAVSLVYTIKLAQAAWKHGTTTFADGSYAFWKNFKHTWLALFGLSIFILLLCSIPGFLIYHFIPKQFQMMIFEILLSVMVFPWVYVMPAILLDSCTFPQSLTKSIKITSHHFKTTLGLIVGTGGVMLAIQSVSSQLGILGSIVNAVTICIGSAYFWVVVVGVYASVSHEVLSDDEKSSATQ